MQVNFGVNQNNKQCFFCAGLNRGYAKSDSIGVFELNKKWHFYGLAFIWLFFNQVKKLIRCGP